MSLQAAPDYFVLSDYTSVLRRRWKSVAVVTLAGLVLGGAYVVLAPKTYTATVLVQVNALPNNANAVGGRTGGPVNMDNEGQAVRSAAVAAIVKSKLHSQLPVTDISQDIHVAVPPNSTFLQITCGQPTALGAQKCANAVGRAYLYNRRVGVMKLVGAGINALEKDATKLRGKIETLKLLLYTTRHKTGVIPGSTVIEGDQLKLAAAKSALASVRGHINTAKPLYDSVAGPDNPVVGNIASPATLPTAPSSPRKLLYLPSGLIAGLVVGMGLAFAAERRDKRVHSVRDVERLCGQPTLLSLSGKRLRAADDLDSPRTAAGRAFIELARYVITDLGDDGHVLAVAATSPGNSASIVAGTLASALARTADETVLICGDMHGTRAPELLGASRGRGLAEEITGAASVTDVLSDAFSRPRLRVVTPGIDVARATAAVQESTVKRAINDLLADARYVIIEVQSMGENSDTFGLARFAEAAVMAVEVERSRPADIAACAERLNRLGARVLGTAVVAAGLLSRRTKIPEPPQNRPQDRPYASSIKSYETPADQPEFTPSTIRGLRETMPIPMVKPGKRGGYPNPADPATGD